MGTDPAKTEDSPAMQEVLNALDDPDCRIILKETTQPMTAKALSKTCEIPQSTVYRKLDILSTAGLLRELHSIHHERGRITRYQRDFNDLNIHVTADDQFEVTISRPKRTARERLAEMWFELGDEL